MCFIFVFVYDFIKYQFVDADSRRLTRELSRKGIIFIAIIASVGRKRVRHLLHKFYSATELLY